MSLFDLPTPVLAPIRPPEPQKDYTLLVRQTRTGRLILVCTSPTAPAEAVAEAEEKGLPLFTGPEIMRMANCPPEVVEELIKQKLIFPGCTVEQVLSGAIKR